MSNDLFRILVAQSLLLFAKSVIERERSRLAPSPEGMVACLFLCHRLCPLVVVASRRGQCGRLSLAVARRRRWRLVTPGMWVGWARWRWRWVWVRRWRRCRWRWLIRRAQGVRRVRRMRHLRRRRPRRQRPRGARRARAELVRRLRIPPVVRRRVQGGVAQVVRLQVRMVKHRRPRAAAVRRTGLRLRRGLRRVIRGRVLWCRGLPMRRVPILFRLICHRRILLRNLLCPWLIRLMWWATARRRRGPGWYLRRLRRRR